MFTYRAESHSTSDDPTRYRPADEGKAWPLGDPVERLKQHLTALGEWDDKKHEAAQAEALEQVKAANTEASANGTLGEGKIHSVSTMFEDVFKDMPEHLRRQRQQLGV
jgi:2-oxoisovalerate dehydrogenase E1 component alpha subunit